MGAMKIVRADWVRRNQHRYLSDGAPQAALDAVQHVLAARAALEVGELEVAEFMYLGARRLWKNMERIDPGHWTEEIRETNHELNQIHHPVHH